MWKKLFCLNATNKYINDRTIETFKTSTSNLSNHDNETASNQMVPLNSCTLEGFNRLPNEVIVNYLFPYLSIGDIKKLSRVGDERLKTITNTYLDEGMLEENMNKLVS